MGSHEGVMQMRTSIRGRPSLALFSLINLASRSGTQQKTRFTSNGSFALVLLLLTTSIPGCLGGEGDSSDLPGEDDPFNAPRWDVADWWLYTFSTPEFSDDTTRLVVAEDDAEGGTAYMLAISNRIEARRHAVLNHNPFLGRITHDNLSAFENGEAQSVFQFPFEKGDSWTFSLFGNDWTADVLEVHVESDGATRNRIAVITATASDGASLAYIFDESAGFLRTLIWTDSSGIEQLTMQLATNGANHKGDVWFIRGGDLFSKSYELEGGVDVDAQDSFFVSDHPSGEDWDEMIYWLSANMGGGTSSGTLTLRDHASLTALAREWGPGASEEGQLGTIPYPSGEYTLTITQSGDSDISIIVAGGISYSWTL